MLKKLLAATKHMNQGKNILKATWTTYISSELTYWMSFGMGN
jgi:hypothetical protein